MLGKLRQRLGRKMRRDRIVLHRGAEFVSDLLIDGVDDFLVGQHKKAFRFAPFIYAGPPDRQFARRYVQKPRARFQARGFCSGDVLLIRSLPFAHPLPSRARPSIRRPPGSAYSLLE